MRGWVCLKGCDNGPSGPSSLIGCSRPRWPGRLGVLARGWQWTQQTQLSLNLAPFLLLNPVEWEVGRTKVGCGSQMRIPIFKISASGLYQWVFSPLIILWGSHITYNLCNMQHVRASMEPAKTSSYSNTVLLSGAELACRLPSGRKKRIVLIISSRIKQTGTAAGNRGGDSGLITWQPRSNCEMNSNSKGVSVKTSSTCQWKNVHVIWWNLA